MARTYVYLKTAAPSSTDDASAGYSVGDNWLDTTNDYIYKVIDTTNSAAIWYQLANIHVGASAPASPVTNQLWWETDTAILWTYGTYASSSRWVSADLDSSRAGQAGSAATANNIHMANLVSNTAYDIYIDSFYVVAYVTSANSGNTGSHYWNFSIRKVATTTAPAVGAGTLLGSGVNSSAASVSTWFQLSESIDAILDCTGASIEVPIYNFTKTGTPGDLWHSGGFSYRLVHP